MRTQLSSGTVITEYSSVSNQDPHIAPRMRVFICDVTVFHFLMYTFVYHRLTTSKVN